MGVDPSLIDSIVAQIEKTYDKNTIHKGSEAARVPRIPFPSLELNIATGGGVPLGRISRFYGQWSSGKTLTCLNTVRAAQNLNLIAEQMLESESDVVKRRGEKLLEYFPNGLEVAYYNVEKVYDKEFANNLGIDTDRLLVVEGSIIEKIGTIIEGSLGGIHLHIVDTASAAASLDEINSKIEDWHRGIKARSWNKVLDHVQEQLDPIYNAVIIVDQVRVNQQTGSHMVAGGEKLEHASSMTVQFKRGKWLYDRDGVLKEEAPQTQDTIHGKAEADGFEVTAQVKKSRVGRPFRVARMQLDFKTMKFDQNYEMAKAAAWFGLAERSGSWYSVNGDKVQGEAGLRRLLAEDVNLQQQVMDKVNEYVEANP